MSFMKSLVLDRPSFIRPYWYLDYDKRKAQELLTKEYGWRYYGANHLENKLTTFCHNIYLPQKFRVDFRNLTLAAKVRSQKMSRGDALIAYSTKLIENGRLKSYFCDRLSINEIEFGEIMSKEPRSHEDFRNYKKRFKRLSPIFLLMAKFGLVTMSFYLKYCRDQNLSDKNSNRR